MTTNFHCNYCDEDIKKVRVRCAECTDFDLCLKCFSSGAEIGCHRNKHKYQLIDCGLFPIFSSPSKWKASDEVALLDAVELYGFGNWNDIAQFVGTYSADEVKEHFINYYVYGTVGRHTWDTVRENALDIRDHTCEDDRPLSPSLVTPLPSIPDVSPLQQQQLGYMPNRDDFEREFDNDAETLVSLLSISADDDPLDSELKATNIDIYRRRLSERFRRKAVAREYKLVDKFFKQLNQDTNDDTSSTGANRSSAFELSAPVLTKAERKEKRTSTAGDRFAINARDDSNNDTQKLEAKLQICSQFQSEAEQQLLLRNLAREQQIKNRLKELQKQRKNSFKKAGNIENASKTKSGKKKENKKSKMNSMDGTGCVQKCLCSPSGSSKRCKECGDETSLMGAQAQLLPKSRQATSDCAQTPTRDCLHSPLERDDHETNTRRSVSLDSPRDGKFDVYSMPSSRLLSEQEKRFCNTIKLRPSQYLNLKTLILKEHVNKKGRPSTPGKSLLENFDKSKQRKMINFMTKCGWLTN